MRERGDVVFNKLTNGVDADSAPGPTLNVGDPVTWTYVIENVGSCVVTDIDITDDIEGFICNIASLDIGETKECQKIGTVQAGQYSNEGEAFASRQVKVIDPSHYFGGEAPPECGDGIVDPGEECDDGNNNDFDGCRNDCTIPVCGDGIVDPGEQCDDGNTNDNDGCRNDCTTPVCGDGKLDPGEECDDGNTNNDDACRNDCTAPVCGDGILDPGEECDDGNINNDDECRNDCTTPLQCILSVIKTATPEIIVPGPVPSCDTQPGGGKPTTLTFKYTGGGCAASNNSQDPGKTECSGAIDPTLAVNVAAGGKLDELTYSLSPTVVAPLGEFTIHPESFKSNSYVVLTDEDGGTETNKLHTSCSQPLEVGDVYGSLTLVAFNGQGGADTEVTYTYEVTNSGSPLSNVIVSDDQLGLIAGPLTLASPETRTFTEMANITVTTKNIVTVKGDLADGQVCEAMDMATVTVEEPQPPAGSCADGKPIALTFEYTGEPCTATTNAQEGKFVCSGDPAGKEPVKVVMTKDADKITVTPSNETINVNTLVTIARTDGSKLASDTKFDIRQGNTVLQSLSIHTSCSKELIVGDQFGSVILREFVPEP